MSGHSKWSTIKHKKGAKDAKRGKIFTKLIREIHVSVKEGGGPDVDSNPRLRLAVQNAKGQNMPKDNIDRAIKKASGEGGESYIPTTFEGYGPNAVAVFVECLSDNHNRTVSNVRAYFSKYGGSLGTNGSLEFIFDSKGVFLLVKPADFDEDDFTLEVIDAGADEIEVEDEMISITCEMVDFGTLSKKLEEMGVESESAELQRIPNTTVTLDDDAFLQSMKLIDALEDDDDVQKVYHNIDIQEGQYELMS